MSTITPPSWTYTVVSGIETVDCWTGDPDIFPSGIQCYEVKSYSWADADGFDDNGDSVDNDGDGYCDGREADAGTNSDDAGDYPFWEAKKPFSDFVDEDSWNG